MEIKLSAYGIAKDILEARKLNYSLENHATIADLKKGLENSYPKFSNLKYLNFAVGTEYREDNFILSPDDEVVIIPPVSGG